MRTVMVVAVLPVGGHATDLVEAGEDVAVEHLSSQRSVESFDVGVLGGLAGLDRRRFHRFSATYTSPEQAIPRAWTTQFVLGISFRRVMTSTLSCPRCRSNDIRSLDRARKAGGTIGAVAGAAGGYAATIGGARAGAAIGVIAGPPGIIAGGLAGAVMGALLGSAAGCATGAAVGSSIDDAVLNNQECERCGHRFSKPARIESSD